MKRLLGLCMLMVSPLAMAHVGPPAEVWWEWAFDPAIVVPLVAAAIGYAVGVVRLWRRSSYLRVCAFALGWLMLAAALLSPLDALAQVSFAAHMAQHVVLVAFAPPLLVLGAPLGPFLMAQPRRWRRALGRRLLAGAPGRLARRLSRMPVAAALHGLVLWIWHAPAVYQAALVSEPVHIIQHASLLGTALIFWWSVIHSGRYGRFREGSGVLGLFVTAMHAKLLGVLIAFAPTPLYSLYQSGDSPWHLSALEDQQLAGLIMLVPIAAVYLMTGLILMTAWLNRSQPVTEAL